MTTRARFVTEMLGWLNARLAPPGVRLEADTPLFASRAIDSIKILELIAWTERALGRPVPDPQIRLDNFRSVARIAEVFVADAPIAGEEGSDAAA
ncbi:MAG TPA: phosphopantetheine-binding protein [Gemmatimonadaceae bacterium]|nr:phosphopantetheine-binding protein [Gemmatimonadaceae bacterium]